MSDGDGDGVRDDVGGGRMEEGCSNSKNRFVLNHDNLSGQVYCAVGQVFGIIGTTFRTIRASSPDTCTLILTCFLSTISITLRIIM